MSELLTIEEVRARMAALKIPVGVDEGLLALTSNPQPYLPVAASYKHIKSLTQAANDYITYAQNPEGRFRLGIPEVDAMTRGFGRGELAYVTGRSHAGKTQVVLNSLIHNPNAKVVWFTPDEVAELILVKLVALSHGINAEEIEARVKEKDEATVELVKRVAAEEFKNLLVIDASLTLSQMYDAYQEAIQFWSSEADAVVIDFLELIPGDDGMDGVAAKSQGLKRWTKMANVPVICLHQNSRSSAPRGQAAGMSGMRYGGENDAIFVLEVFRKREDESLDDTERRRHENTVSIYVAKNKRPPCHTGIVDLFLDPLTGTIRTLRPNDMSSPRKLDHLLAQVARERDKQLEAF